MNHIIYKFLRWLYQRNSILLKPIKQSYTLLETPEDKRDYTLFPLEEYVPESYIDLRVLLPLPKNQQYIASCMSHATATLLEGLWHKKYHYTIELSELFHYYTARDLLGYSKENKGMDMRTGMKVAQKIGICPEFFCPYDPAKYAEKPHPAAYTFAKWFKTTKYTRLQNMEEMKRVLSLIGIPFVLGVRVTEAFAKHKKRTPILPLKKDNIRGGHAIVCCGYDDERKAFLIQNSWSRNWGFGGYAWLSYEYVKKYYMDAWMMEL